MAENAVNGSQAAGNLKPRLRASGIPTKRAPLSVINSNRFRSHRFSLNNSKLENLLGLTEKPTVFCTEKFQIFADENVEEVTANNTNNLPISSEEVSDKITSESLKYFKIPSGVVKKFPIFADENAEEEVTANNENNLSIYSDEVSDKITSESLKCFEIPSEVAAESPKEENKVSDIDSDPVWCTPYKEDIYSHFKEIEKKYRPSVNYMEKQKDITMNMRSVLVDWLVEVGEEYEIHRESLYLAVSYVDRFLSQMAVVKEKLQLVGVSSMFIATKFEEIYPPDLKNLVYITADAYSKQQILKMEYIILKTLGYYVSGPTPYVFLQIYCSMANASELITCLAQYICELSLLDAYPFLKFLPSVIAAGSLALANYTLGFDMWSKELEESTGFHLSELTYVISCLHEKYSSMSECLQQAICEKYKSSTYRCVSTIQPPKKLKFSLTFS